MRSEFEGQVSFGEEPTDVEFTVSTATNDHGGKGAGLTGEADTFEGVGGRITAAIRIGCCGIGITVITVVGSVGSWIRDIQESASVKASFQARDTVTAARPFRDQGGEVSSKMEDGECLYLLGGPLVRARGCARRGMQGIDVSLK